MKRLIFTLLILSFAASAIAADLTIKREERPDLYFIDAHSQIDHKVGGVDVVLKRMSTNNVTTTLLSTRGKRSWRDILDWSSKYPTKIAPLIRSKGKDSKIILLSIIKMCVSRLKPESL